MFSVIIPLYNKAAYVEKAIRSVLAQTCREFELIVVDDGSADIQAPQPPKGGVKLTYLDIEQLIGNKGRLIRQKNRGVSTARNNGVKAAKYDYVAFLDADDWWEPTYLKEMQGLIEEFPGAGIWGSSYYIVKNNRKRVAPIGVEQNFERGLINYFRVYAKTLCMPLWAGSSVLRRSVFESENGFKPTLKLGEDFDLWIRIAIKYPVALLNKPLSNYNQDVEVQARAIGGRLYEPAEHMLFTDYGELQKNPDFRYLYERLAVYGLLPYYLEGKNKKETDIILKKIHWENHSFKYFFYYRILPVNILKWWYKILRSASAIKKAILKFAIK